MLKEEAYIGSVMHEDENTPVSILLSLYALVSVVLKKHV
jgi:hypothetical protein